MDKELSRSLTLGMVVGGKQDGGEGWGILLGKSRSGRWNCNDGVAAMLLVSMVQPRAGQLFQVQDHSFANLGDQ